MTLYGNFFLKNISQNPFRILGVVANAPKKEIITSVNKFKAFLKVGKPMDGSFDKIEGTDRVERSLESINFAEKSIEIPIDQLKHTLFWFVNNSPYDQIALNHIQSNNVPKAIEIWGKVRSYSSLLNIVVANLTQQNWENAALEADKLFVDCSANLCKLVSETLDLTAEQLMMLFLETIAEDNYEVLKKLYNALPEAHTFNMLSEGGEYSYVTEETEVDETSSKIYPHIRFQQRGCTSFYYFHPNQELSQSEFEEVKDNLLFIGASRNSSYKMGYIYKSEHVALPSKLWDNCIRTVLAKPYVTRAKQTIAAYRAIPKENTSKRFAFAKSKLTSTLYDVYHYLGKDSSDYQSLNNQIVRESLQCAIDYFNAAEDPDEIAKEVKDFMWNVTLTAEPGSMLRQRCKENHDTLCEICAKLPPDSVLYYHRLLKSLIDAYKDKPSTIKNASTFVDQCLPYLMSIKATLGPTNTYYQRMCTRVADDALSDIIAEYNEKSESLHNRLEKANRSDRDNIIKLIQEMMKSAVITMYHIQQLGLESDFRKNRFNQNYAIIVKQARSARALGANSLISMFGGEISEADFNRALKQYEPDLRDEKEYYSSIKSLNDCYTYRKIFPNGKFAKDVNSKVEQYEYAECSSLDDLMKFKVRYPSTKYDLEAKKEEIIFKSCKTIEDYKAYLASHSTYAKEARQKIDDIIFAGCNSRDAYENYLSSYPNGSHRLEAQHKLDDIDYRACKTADDFNKYIKSYPHGCHIADAKKRFEEETFWALCIKKDSWKLYKEYLSKFPYGKYNSEAKKKAKSPKEKFNEWRSNNGCLFTLIIILLVVLVIAGITNGIEGVGYVFAAIGAIGVFGSLGKGDLGCGFRIASLGIGIIAGAIGIGLISVGEDLGKSSKANDSYNSLNDQSTVRDYRNLITSHYNKLNDSQREDAVKRYYSISLDSCILTIGEYSTGGYNKVMSGLGYLTDFIEHCPNSVYKEQAQGRVQELVDSLYFEAERKNSYEGWTEYQNSVSSDDYRDSDERKDAADTRWSSESNAWATAVSLNNIAGYEKYLSLFPNGRHRQDADKKVIDMTVASTFAGEHGTLPEMDQVGYGGGSTSYVSVRNSTSYTLTLMYSGNESKRLVLSPNSTGAVRLKNGSYRIAASVSASNVSRYAGTETLNGGSYEVEYYISTTSVPSYSHY